MTRRVALLVLLLGAACRRESHRVVLVPIGAVPAEVLAQLQRELPRLVKREVVVGAAIPVPPAAYDAGRRQYRAEALLRDLDQREFRDADRILGVIDGDASAPGLNYVFGQARLPGRTAVIALARLRDSFRGRPENEVRFRERVVKVAMHELGHTFGFVHCDRPACVMHFANSFLEIDRQSARYENESVPE